MIQTHLKKLFAGIHSVGFDGDERHITSMRSVEGEVVPLKQRVAISANVEAWLNELSREMKNTLKQLLVECVTDGRGVGGQGMDPLKYPSQVNGYFL